MSFERIKKLKDKIMDSCLLSFMKKHHDIHVFVFSEYLYTGTLDGRIVSIHKGEIREVTRLGQMPCG